jgi:hypothetical protein
MERITPNQVVGLMEAYNTVYAPQVNEDYLWESYLTEEFISEAYQTVADYLVNNGFVPGYNTAEVYMSEMVVEDIDSILFETGVLDEQYLLEAGFFQNLANTAIGGVQRAGSAVAGGVKKVASGADRAVGGAVRAGQTAVGAAQRAGQTAVGAAQRAGSAVAGAAQRAGGAVQRAVTPVAQAVQGTAQRAVSAGQSALNTAGRAVQGAAQGAVRGATAAGQAVAGGAQRAVSAVGGAVNTAGRRIGQEVEISRKVGAGEPLNKPTFQNTGGYGRYGAPSSQVKTPSPTPTAGAKPAPSSAPGTTPIKPAGAPPTPTEITAKKPGMVGSSPEVKSTNTASTNPSSGTTPIKPAGAPPTPTEVTAKKPSLASGVQDLRQMRAASQQRIMAQGGKPVTPPVAPNALVQSFDPFDVVLGHLIDEGYADTEEAALQIMANMSEEWRESIVEVTGGGKVEYKPIFRGPSGRSGERVMPHKNQNPQHRGMSSYPGHKTSDKINQLNYKKSKTPKGSEERERLTTRIGKLQKRFERDGKEYQDYV